MATPATREQFISGMVDLMRAGRAANPNPGVADVQAVSDAAWARVKKGNGQVGTLIQGMLNGKQGQLAVGMDCLELFSACQEAIRRFNEGQGNTSHADFFLFAR